MISSEGVLMFVSLKFILNISRVFKFLWKNNSSNARNWDCT